MKVDILVAGTSSGGTGTLGRIIRELDKTHDKVTVCVSHGIHQDGMTARIAEDLRCIARLTAQELPVELYKESYEGLHNDQVFWRNGE